MKIKKNRVNCLDLKEQCFTEMRIKRCKAITKEIKKWAFFFICHFSD